MLPDRTVGFGMSVDGQIQPMLDPSRSSLRKSKTGGGVIEVQIPTAAAQALSKAQTAETWFDYSRAEGGDYAARFTFSDMDRAMLAAAFSLCI